MTGYHLLLLVAATVSAGAAWTDWRTGHIPNWLSFGALAGAPALHAVLTVLEGGSSTDAGRAVFASLLGAFACGILPYLLFRRDALGGGDVKLFAAMGALCRPVVGFHAETYAFIVGMIFALVMVGLQGKLRTTFGNVASLLKPPAGRHEGAFVVDPSGPQMTSFRFAPSIFVGVCIAAALDWRAG
ncbi:hypothetical protein AKJ09_00746 [Labilithrix luteola]|uniref:Prepilin type IV endopeptidase peptidase domain-containing protein n=1 Tax=Labilithrix luteola TaxID=1391654 RepID=A0A0K1PKN7_9BACT|nr:A24 family peptidase [Labilithrix luteola]AKU94082.1 hypothetical protein AKJ09_00746 [Labilithrix luteola]